MTQVTRQEESDRARAWRSEDGLALPPVSGPGLVAHRRRPSLAPCPPTKHKASSFQSRAALALCFQLPAHPLPAQLSHAFVSQLAKTPDGDRPASTPGVCLCGTPGAPRALFIPKQQRKEVTASSQHANPCKPHSL